MAKTALIMAFILLGLASTSFAQAANQSFRLSIAQTAPNPAIHISIPNYTTPVNLLSLTAVTNLRINGSMGGNTVYLQVQNGNSLSAMGVNVLIPQGSGNPPFYSAAQLGITPATKSGTYNITILAISAGLQNSSTVIHLHVFNPTNATFISGDPTKIPTIAQASQELSGSFPQVSPATGTNSSKTSQSSNVQQYYYLLVVVAIIIIASLVVWLRRKT
ncbi:MAG: hypothetical protein KGH53_03010 [Candidatus Micrarchaeota archaeon]|nr:hypothetical protein [Candidatus Micrarchaeota archaeon]